MAKLPISISQALERVLRLNEGHFLDLTNASFEIFIRTSANIEIMSEEYAKYGTSKGKRFKALIEKADEDSLAKIISEISKTAEYISRVSEYKTEGEIIANYLSSFTGSLSAIDFEHLSLNSLNHKELFHRIRLAVENGMPQAATDAIHTMMFSYLKNLCSQAGIVTTKPNGDNKSIESLIGEYVKLAQCSSLIEDYHIDMLKSLNKRMSALNLIRNTMSLAHANPLLRSEDADMIINAIASDFSVLRTAHAKMGF